LGCTGTGRSYKIESFLKSGFVKIDKKRARLDAKKDRINKKVRLYSSRVNTVLVKIIRIRKLRRFLASREAEMIRCSLENIEELEKLEEQEKLNILLVLSVTVVIFSKNIFASSFFSGELNTFLTQKYLDLFNKNL
jgi:hypothetical protein